MSPVRLFAFALAVGAVCAGLLACTYVEQRSQCLTRGMRWHFAKRAALNALAAVGLTVGAFALALV